MIKVRYRKARNRFPIFLRRLRELKTTLTRVSIVLAIVLIIAAAAYEQQREGKNRCL
jgi:hypothetical protein